MIKFNRLLVKVATTLFLLGIGGLVVYRRWEINTIKRIRLTPASERASEIERHHNFVLSRIKKGMSKAQVERIVGLPQNTDSQHVWAWAFGGESGDSDNKKWMDLIDNGLMYIVFIDDKVVGNPESVYASAAQTPCEMVMGLRNCDAKTAMILLGQQKD